MVNFAQPTKPIRTRFAPSPTGFVHIGSLRTALFAFLFARHNQGVNVLRIEDTDQNRQVEGALENLLRVMKQIGVEFDEGFYLGKNGQVAERGEHGPYLQSKRLNIYQEAINKLIENGSAYYCFCTQERLDDLRKEQTALKKPPMYDRHCRNLPAEESKKRAAGEKHVVRFAVPLEGQTTVRDLIYGDIVYENKILDDQVILKSDGFPTYHLAVVVDDHHMEISHVIRGEEWLPSTPKHLLIYKALGWEPTEFAHLPLILNADKSKLSKRQGDVSVEDFLAKGYLKEALINFVAFLGWNPKTEQEIFSLTDLIKQFDLAKVNKSGAVFDPNKLDWLNSIYIREMPSEDLAVALMPYWQNSGIKVEKFEKKYLAEIAKLEQQRLKKLSEIGERTKYFFQQPEYDANLLVWKKADAQDAKIKLAALLELFETFSDADFEKENLENKIKKFISRNNYDNGSVLWPLRTSLTGQQASPGPFEVAAALFIGIGKEGIIKRIKNAISKL